jgi:hypothetical protein
VAPGPEDSLTDVMVVSSVISSVTTVTSTGFEGAAGPREAARDERRDVRPWLGASADEGSKAPLVASTAPGWTEGAREVRRDGGREAFRGEVIGPREGARPALRGEVNGPKEGARD